MPRSALSPGRLPGTFVLETLLNSAGYLVEWFRSAVRAVPR